MNYYSKFNNFLKVCMEKVHMEQNWSSRWGFVVAAMSSAIGLANIWRFPFLVGQYGGGAFIITYCLCLVFAGLPIFVIEALIGRESGSSCAKAMYDLTKRPIWKLTGLLLVATAFLVSSYYAVIAGWVMGYWAQSFTGELSHLINTTQAKAHFQTSIASFSFTWVWPASFLLLSASVVAAGVRSGLERASRWLMPILFTLLIGLVVWCFISLEASKILNMVFSPDWSRMSAIGILAALGQAFFTLSLGQGTIITYGSYLKRHESLLPLALPVAIADSAVSLLATIIVFSVCSQSGVALDVGPSLVFETLPVLFNLFSLGSVLSFLFFTLLLLATLSSEMSAIEPVVAWLSPRFGRKKALVIATCAMLLVMLPAAASYRGVSLGWWKSATLIWQYDALCTRLLIPCGGALALIFIHFGWGLNPAMQALRRTQSSGSFASHYVERYFLFCYKWATPILIALTFLHSVYNGN